MWDTAEATWSKHLPTWLSECQHHQLNKTGNYHLAFQTNIYPGFNDVLQSWSGLVVQRQIWFMEWVFVTLRIQRIAENREYTRADATDKQQWHSKFELPNTIFRLTFRSSPFAQNTGKCTNPWSSQVCAIAFKKVKNNEKQHLNQTQKPNHPITRLHRTEDDTSKTTSKIISGQKAKLSGDLSLQKLGFETVPWLQVVTVSSHGIL